MRAAPTLVLALFLSAGIVSGRTGAADAAESGCLSADQRRAAIAGHRAIPLAHAVRDVKGRVAGGEVVRAALCHRDQRLVYVLTVLAHDGKVTHASIDAASGAVLEAR